MIRSSRSTSSGKKVSAGPSREGRGRQPRLDGVRRIVVDLSVSAEYLEGTVTAAAFARALGEREFP